MPIIPGRTRKESYNDQQDRYGFPTMRIQTVIVCDKVFHVLVSFLLSGNDLFLARQTKEMFSHCLSVTDDNAKREQRSFLLR